MGNRIRFMASLLMGLVMSISCMPVQAQIIHPSEKRTYKASELKPASKLIWDEDTELVMDVPLSVASIQCDGELVITGSALLKVECSSGDAVSALSLECSAPMTIDGSGKAAGISAAEHIYLTDCAVTVRGVRDGLTADTGSINVRGGNLEVDCKGSGLLSNSYNIGIHGDTVIRSGGNSIAALNGKVNVSANLTANATNEGSMCIYAKGGGVYFEGNSSYLRSRGTCIWSDDEIIFNTDVDAASSDSSAVRYKGEESHKVIQINQGNVILSGKDYAVSSNSFFYQLGGTLTCSGGIWAKRNIWLDKGETSITCSGEYPALHANDIDVRSRLIIDAEKSDAVAVYTPLCGNVTLESDFVNITARHDAVVSNGTLSLSGSAVIVSLNGAALVSHEDMKIIDGIFMLIGDSVSVYSRKNIMTGRCDLTADGQMYSAYGSISLGGKVEVTSTEGSAVEAEQGVILVTGNLKGAAIGSGNHVLDGRYIQFEEGSEAKLDCEASAVYSKDQVVSRGNVRAMSKEEEAIYAKGDLKVENGSLHAEGHQDAVYSEGSITLAENMHIRIPEDGYISYRIIRNSHGGNAPEVLINKDISYVTFRADNGTGDEVVVRVETGSAVTLPDSPFAAPSGKRFAGWDKGMPGTSITVNADMVINALWEYDFVQVSFLANGGSGSMSPVLVIRGSYYTVPSCQFTAPTGKQFYGWEVNGEYTAFAGTTVTITKESVFKAV
ncbi:MAG: carbohydrate-binding domain-containing protein, partial [Solobacterium sp.]|nr:carbohydrate-binding domain-containing protein [Solobacterium sp.]